MREGWRDAWRAEGPMTTYIHKRTGICFWYSYGRGWWVLSSSSWFASSIHGICEGPMSQYPLDKVLETAEQEIKKLAARSV